MQEASGVLKIKAISAGMARLIIQSRNTGHIIAGLLELSNPKMNRAIELLMPRSAIANVRSEEHTSELQSRENLVCRLLLEKKKKTTVRLLAQLLAPHAE